MLHQNRGQEHHPLSCHLYTMYCIGNSPEMMATKLIEHVVEQKKMSQFV